MIASNWSRRDRAGSRRRDDASSVAAPPRHIASPRRAGRSLEQASLPWIDVGATATRAWLAACGHANSAIMEFEIERRTGVDTSRFGDHPADGVTDHDIAACEQAFMALGMRSKPSCEIVEQLVFSVDK